MSMPVHGRVVSSWSVLVDRNALSVLYASGSTQALTASMSIVTELPLASFAPAVSSTDTTLGYSA
jgi:hypothetical protein